MNTEPLDQAEPIEPEVVKETDERARRLEEVGIRPGTMIVGVTSSVLGVSTPVQLERVRTALATRIQAIELCDMAALRMTTENDWICHDAGGGDLWPYLMDSGCQKIEKVFPIDFMGEPIPERILYPITDSDGNRRDAYQFRVAGAGRCPAYGAAWQYTMGSAWSEDPFLTKGGKKIPDPGDVEKKCRTNFHGNVIRKVFGLERAEWAKMKAAGLDIDRIRKSGAVDVSGGARGAQRRGEKAAANKWTGPALAVTLDPNMPRFLECKEALKRAGAQWSPDSSNRWFLQPTTDAKRLISQLDLIGQTQELDEKGEPA